MKGKYVVIAMSSMRVPGQAATGDPKVQLQIRRLPAEDEGTEATDLPESLSFMMPRAAVQGVQIDTTLDVEVTFNND